MKKQLFLLFSLLFLGTWSIAQIDLTVNGVVVDPMGNPVPNVTIYVETDSTFAGPGYFNTLTTDATGAFSDAFTLNSAPSQGALYVTMVNCPGQSNISVTNFWNPGNYDFSYAFLYCETLPPVCDASILVDSLGTGLILTGESTGQAPFTYAWNTGENTQSITPNTFGTFCVTITDAAGCLDEACYTIDPPVPCDVVVFQGQMDDLIASVTGSGPFTFIWSTGETTSTIYPFVSGDYCVTITDGTGCSASDCYSYSACSVDISVAVNPGGNSWDLTANATGPSSSFTYVWDNGEFGQTITVQAAGTYCVTVSDANGCISSGCITVSPNNPCGVIIDVSVIGDLTAIPTGEAPYTYSWATGATTPSITPDVPGTYCVTITDATGCAATECYVFAGACSVSFSSMPVGNNAAVATATATGAAPFTYLWDSGETTESILVTTSGLYCVTMADANGCTAVYCDSIVVTNPDNNLIAGQIFLGDETNVNAPVTGEVYLIVYDDQAGTLTAVDTVGIASTPVNFGGYYSFGSVADGDYLVKVALDPTSPGYAENLPTYYGDVLFWDEATTITTPYMGVSSFDITTVAGVNPGGPGFIGGLISDGANLWGGGSDRGDDPIAGVSVLLLNQDEEPVTHTESAEDGTFGFPDLDWGTYKLVVEIWGIPQGEKWVTIGPDNPSVEDIEFEVTDNSINTNTNELSVLGTLSVHPNPVQDAVVIELPEADLRELQVVDLAGRIVETQTVERGQASINMQTANWKAGWYLIRLIGADGIYLAKVTKQ